MADEPRRPRVAEAAGQGAADLRGDAERAARLLRDVDGLDLLPVGEAQQPLARAVFGELRRRDLRPVDRIVRLQQGADRLRQGRHLGEVPRSEEHTSELQSLMRISYA